MKDSIFISEQLGTLTSVISVDAPSRSALTRAVGKLDEGRIELGCGHDCSGRVCGQYAKLLKAYQIPGGSWRGVVEVTTAYDV
jgi:hypothetical protein